MGNKKVQLSGKCTLQIDTIMSRTKIEIPKVNRDGENNADVLIDNVLHFGVMRHGKNKMREIIEEKLNSYEEKYDDEGLNYPD